MSSLIKLQDRDQKDFSSENELWIWHSVQDFDTFTPFLLAPKGIRVLSAAAQRAHIFVFTLNIKEVEDQTKKSAVQSPSIKIKTELEKVGQMCGAVADYGTICFESRTLMNDLRNFLETTVQCNFHQSNRWNYVLCLFWSKKKATFTDLD